jgi:hypothetical protein
MFVIVGHIDNIIIGAQNRSIPVVYGQIKAVARWGPSNIHYCGGRVCVVQIERNIIFPGSQISFNRGGYIIRGAISKFPDVRSYRRKRSSEREINFQRIAALAWSSRYERVLSPKNQVPGCTKNGQEKGWNLHSCNNSLKYKTLKKYSLNFFI